MHASTRADARRMTAANVTLHEDGKEDAAARRLLRVARSLDIAFVPG
jgi:hypothetical protein